MAAPLLVVALCFMGGAAAWAQEQSAEVVVSADRSDALGVVSIAQSDDGTDPDPDSDLRLVERESSERVDAVVIALWVIAAGMSALLGVFLWHTSPRRRLRMARSRSVQLYSEAQEDSEPSTGPFTGEPEHETDGESDPPAEELAVSEESALESDADADAPAEESAVSKDPASESGAGGGVPPEESAVSGELALESGAGAGAPGEEPAAAETADGEREPGLWVRLRQAVGLD